MSLLQSLLPGLYLFAGFILAIALAVVAHRVMSTRRVRFRQGGASLFIDEEAKLLVVSQTDRNQVERFPLNTLTWRATSTGVLLTSFRLPDAFIGGVFNEHDKTTVRGRVEVWLGGGRTGPLMRWLNYRANRLAPDTGGHYRVLNERKKALAAAARQHLPEAPLIECDTGRVIERYAYVAFLPSGAVYGMPNALSSPEPVLRVRAGDVHRGKGRTVDVEFRQGSSATFELNGRERQHLRELQEKGLLHLDAPLPALY